MEQETLLNRIGRIFRRNGKINGQGNGGPLVQAEISPTSSVSTPLVRPWGRNQAAISQLQEGFQSLTELMNAIRLSMETQGRRQDELLGHLSALPRVLEMLPESNRLQGQTLKAIHDQLMQQADQQHTLGEILEKLSEDGGDQREILQGLRERVETLNQQDRAMADSLNTVGAALESASRNSATSAEVLGKLNDNLHSRDQDLERVLRRQGARLTTMLWVAIGLSVVALAAVAVMGYLMQKAGK
ncbi:MAG: type II secretion system F family protein [Tepidisphaeraceae bacterium]|jgi:chromosome segregation ATPase